MSFEWTHRYAGTAAVLVEADETTMITLELEHTHWWNFFRFCIFITHSAGQQSRAACQKMLEEEHELAQPKPVQMSFTQFSSSLLSLTGSILYIYEIVIWPNHSYWHGLQFFYQFAQFWSPFLSVIVTFTETLIWWCCNTPHFVFEFNMQATWGVRPLVQK